MVACSAYAGKHMLIISGLIADDFLLDCRGTLYSTESLAEGSLVVDKGGSESSIKMSATLCWSNSQSALCCCLFLP